MFSEKAIRAFRMKKQGLGPSWSGLNPSKVLNTAGWARTVGSANTYLSLFARAGTHREAAEAAVKSLDIHELPSARGCTYQLPNEHFDLGLRMASIQSEDLELKQAIKYLGATAEEFEVLEEAVLRALEQGVMDPKALKGVLGDKVRNFGPEGKKRGLTTSLPIAVKRLQMRGMIRRVPVDGRLDHERYAYTIWKDSPARPEMPFEELLERIGRAYFSWAGPATLAEFSGFTLWSQTKCRPIIDLLGLVDLGDGRLLHREDRDELESFSRPNDPQYALVHSMDSIMQLRRNIGSMIDEKYRDFPAIGSEKAVNTGGLSDLVCNAILDRGTIIGYWEFDPELKEIVAWSWEGITSDLRQEVQRTESFIRDELGDSRAHSLDSPASRRPRIEALRQQIST